MPVVIKKLDVAPAKPMTDFLNPLPPFEFTFDQLVNSSGQIAEARLLSAAYDQIRGSTYPVHEITLRDKASMWKVSSAIQKCIRRGFPELAVKYAQAMINGGVGDYLWRRLPVIAYEDVGIANLVLSAQVLALCRFKQYRDELGGDRHIASWMVDSMSRSCKSRTITDLSCSWYFKKANYVQELQYGHLNSEAYAAEDWMDKVVRECALATALLGYYEKDQEFRVSKADQAQGLKNMVNDLIKRGQWVNAYALYAGTKKNTENGTPHVYPVVTTILDKQWGPWVEKLAVQDPQPKMYGGVPEWSFDGHVHDGKKAMYYVMKSCKPLQEAFDSLGYEVDRHQVLGMLLFQTQSAILDRDWQSPQTKEILERNDVTEGQYAGLKTVADVKTIRTCLESPEFVNAMSAARGRVIEGIPTH